MGQASISINPSACLGGNRVADLAVFDRIVQRAMDVLIGVHGARSLHLVGGTSQAVLLAGLENRPLTLRDLDIAILGIKPAEARMVEVARSLELGEVSDFRPRPRGPINAGHGIYVNHPTFGVVDLIFFFNETCSKLNGLFTVDNIGIRLCPQRVPRDRAVSWILERLAREGAGPLVAEGLIRDRFRGVEDLRARRLRLARRGPYFSRSAEKLNALVRGIKQAAKWRVRLDDPEILRMIEENRDEMAALSREFGPTRNLVKMLAAPGQIIPALEELRSTGGLSILFPELGWVARSQDRWDDLIQDILRVRRGSGAAPAAEASSLDLMDAVTRRIAQPEWARFARRLEPVLGREIVDAISGRRVRRTPWIARLAGACGGFLARILPGPIPRRRRGLRLGQA